MAVHRSGTQRTQWPAGRPEAGGATGCATDCPLHRGPYLPVRVPGACDVIGTINAIVDGCDFGKRQVPPPYCFWLRASCMATVGRRHETDCRRKHLYAE